MRGRQRSVLLLLVLVVAAIMLAVLRNTDAGSAVQGAALAGIAPVRSALTGASSGAAAALTDAQRFNEVRAENEALRAEVAQLRSAAASVRGHSSRERRPTCGAQLPAKEYGVQPVDRAGGRT